MHTSMPETVHGIASSSVAAAAAAAASHASIFSRPLNSHRQISTPSFTTIQPSTAVVVGNSDGWMQGWTDTLQQLLIESNPVFQFKNK